MEGKWTEEGTKEELGSSGTFTIAGEDLDKASGTWDTGILGEDGLIRVMKGEWSNVAGISTIILEKGWVKIR